ncbi:MAG: RimK family alpha-L-glutamate ligase [Desulfobacterales bacterium]|nr:RimK family alpha-L-glutamate ligase [Desulfobacterales bacterium]
MHTGRTVIALEARLRACKNVITLGVRPNFGDYGPEKVRMIREAAIIYYPTVFYADLFDAMGKATFPSYHTYKCVQDKIKQTALLQMLDIPHPRTRVFYGKHQKSKILDGFDFPLIAKTPRGSALGRGVFLIHGKEELQAYCRDHQVAYIQEYLPIDRDMRIVVIGGEVVHAYWRKSPEGEFRTNVFCGGEILLEEVPAPAIELARNTAQACRWNDVGVDICRHAGQYYVIEANMKYGREGFRKAGIDYINMMEKLIDNETI